MKFLKFYFLLCATPIFAQFSGAAGTISSDAIHKDSSIIIGWASTCTINRGPMDISNPSGGIASYGTETDATGMADGVSVVSLGDGGSAILSFDSPIYNGNGPDFAVFENSFSDNFLELAFVEVSSDGTHFYRFPATSNTPTNTQIGPFSATTDPTHLNNLAGKHRANYGTPFDLEELDTISGLNIQSITHIKIIDVVGSIDPNYGQTDSHGNLINDPFPTAFPSSGFDLDAIGVIHQVNVGINEVSDADFRIFPNPINQDEKLHILGKNQSFHVTLSTIDGKNILETTSPIINIESAYLSKGTYILKITNGKHIQVEKIIVK